jgi:hypothetical protein
MSLPDAASLLDWRRKVAAIYAAVRASADPAAAHRFWRDARNEMLATHPQSPVPAAERPRFRGVPVAAFDHRMRFTARLDANVEPARMEVATGTDGTVPFERVGVVHLDGVGDLDVWRLASYGGGVFVPIKDTRSDGATYPGRAIRPRHRQRRRPWR